MASRTAACAFSRRRHHRQPQRVGALADQRHRVLDRRRARLDEQVDVQRRELVLQLQRGGVVALQARRLEFRAQPRRHVRGHRDAAVAAVGVEAERGDVLAGELVEVLAHRHALLRHPRHVGGRVLHAGDVLQLIEPLHRVDVDVDDRAGGNVVHDDRNADRVVDRLEVLVEPLLGRLVVVGRDHQHGVGAGLLGVLRQADRLGGRVRARARDHRNPALGLIHAPFDDLLVLLVATASGFRRWCRPERGRWCPRRSASPPGRGTPFRRPSRS